MGQPMTVAKKLLSDPALKRFTKDELKKMVTTPEVRELILKLSLKHELPAAEVRKALLAEIQIEAKELKDSP